jgi:hypothetical protein
MCPNKLGGCDSFHGTVEIFTCTDLPKARKFFEGRGDFLNENWARGFFE